MRQDVADKWAALLESGEISQTRDRLKDSNGMCCLGVLCVLYQRETGRGRWTEENHFVTNTDVGSTVPPREVRQWAGMQSTEGIYSGRRSLMTDNDHGATFSTIAATIRANVDTL